MCATTFVFLRRASANGWLAPRLPPGEETDLGTRPCWFLNFAVFSAVEVILNCQEVKSTESGIQECEEFGFEGGGGDFAGGVYM